MQGILCSNLSEAFYNLYHKEHTALTKYCILTLYWGDSLAEVASPVEVQSLRTVLTAVQICMIVEHHATSLTMDIIWHILVSTNTATKQICLPILNQFIYQAVYLWNLP